MLGQGNPGIASLPNAINIGNSRMAKGPVLTPMTPLSTSGLGSYPLTPSSTSTTNPSTPGGSSGIGVTTPVGSSNGSNNNSPNKFECDICKLKFASNYNLKRHARTHDESRPRWQCSFCDKSFTRRDSLPKHMNFVHKDQVSVKDEDPNLEAGVEHEHEQGSPEEGHPCST